MKGRSTVYIPPKLPETTNLVFTNRRKEYKEIKAMNVNIALENKMPPLKKLDRQSLVYYDRIALSLNIRFAKE